MLQAIGVSIGVGLLGLAAPILIGRLGHIGLALGTVVGFNIVYGYHAAFRWDIVGVWARELWLALFAVVVLVTVRFYRRRLSDRWRRASPALKTVIAAAAAIGGAATVVSTPSRHTPPTDAVALAWPFADGDYYVAQGGPHPIYNHHFDAPAQRYALDVTALDDWGRRAAGLAPHDVSAFEIFDRPVVAPCAGAVVYVSDGAPDAPIGVLLDGAPAGNAVAIACDAGVTVLLAHLRTGVPVQVGTRVAVGAMIGRIGNSGRSTEPHLHFHAVAGRVDDLATLLTNADGVPMAFAGRVLARNDIVEAGALVATE